jgi:signal transduction histidine kinase
MSVFVAVSALIVGTVEALHAARRRAEQNALEAERQREALRQQAEEVQTLLDTLPIGVFFAHDPACRQITGNRAGHELLRMPPPENLSKTAPPGEQPKHFRVCRNGVEIPSEQLPVQRAARGEQVRNEEVEHVFKDGAVVHTLVSAAPLLDSQGQPRGAVAGVLDITELKQSQEEVRRLNRVLQGRVEQLAEADRQKDQFLAMLAHELRNPLAPIRNAVHLLQQSGPEEPRFIQLCEVIQRQVHQQARLLDDLLDASRIARGMVELHPQRLDLVRLVRDTVEDCRGVLETADLTLSLALPEEPVWVEGDPTRLSQVVANLLLNSAKFTERGGRVTVQMAVGPGGERVAVHVRDTGIGIEPEMLPRVFETFAQADRSLERSRGGLGLGLALVKGLVELHQGEVRAASEGVGRGSEFTVLLPITASPVEAEEALAPGSGSVGPIRILVVDDNKDAADTLGQVLELTGCTVAVAYSGPAAVELASQFRPEVVLCDLGLPGMSGYEVAAALRQDRTPSKPRLIAISGYGQEEDQRRSCEAGFDLHLTKPVDVEELQRLLEVRPARRRT